jgi:hypothetical protein
MPRSAGSTGIPPVVPVGINLTGGSALALRVFVLVVVPVVTGDTSESPVVPVGQFPEKLIFVVNCTSGSTGC